MPAVKSKKEVCDITQRNATTQFKFIGCSAGAVYEESLTSFFLELETTTQSK
jgi:hypothetical protein